MIQTFQDNGHRTYVIPHKSWLRTNSKARFAKNLIQEMMQVNKFRYLYDEVSPDIVYVNTLASISAVVAARISKVYCVWHIRELFDNVGGEMIVPANFVKLVQKAIKWLPQQIIVNSRAVSKNILGEVNQSIHIVPNAVQDDFLDVPINKYKAKIAFKLAQDKLVIGVPGTLRPMKGHKFFLKAVAPLILSRKDLVVVISGDGDPDYVDSLYTMTAALGISSKVHFLGRIRAMTNFYHVCDVAVVPSRAEPFGRVIIESFASKLPVVATAVGGIPEIIENRLNGILVDYGDESGLRHAIELLLSDKELACKLSEQAQRDAKRLYSAQVYQTRIIDVVNAML